jgi:hypothetical protein
MSSPNQLASRRSSSAALSLAALAGLLLTLPACKDDAYARVSVLTFSDTISNVARFRVYVNNGADLDVLYYPRQPTESLTLDTTHPVTFSVEFSSSRGGPTVFEVEPVDVDDRVLGYGKAEAAIVKENVFDVAVAVVPGAVRPAGGLDGGTPQIDAGASSCDPYNAGGTCGAGQTCGLVCAANQPAIGMCYVAGPATPGGVCATNNDCSAGSQCFTFTAAGGCNVSTCLRFCTGDTACGETGAFCNVPIPCGTSPAYKACSRPCDPTGTGLLGCAPGLACYVYSDETTDCACPGAGLAGSACTRPHGCNGEAGCAGCAAGLSCIVPTGSTTGVGACRPICKLAAPATCPTGTSCRSFAGSARLTYGFCE